MPKPGECSEASQRVLIDEWPIEKKLCNCTHLIAIDDVKLLVAIEDKSDYIDCCYVIDLERRTATKEKLPVPDWVESYWKYQKSGPGKGFLDLSVTKTSSGVKAAAVAKAGYVACWELGKSAGLTIEHKFSVSCASVSPDGEYVAIGTGKTGSGHLPGNAEIQIWSTSSDAYEPVSKRLPGHRVVNILWTSSPHDLDYFICGDQWRNQVILATAMAKGGNELGGFAAMLSLPDLYILELLEVDDPADLYGIAAWPEKGFVYLGGGRNLSEFHETIKHSRHLHFPGLQQKTAGGWISGVVLSDGRHVKFAWGEKDEFVLQIWSRVPK